MKRNNDIKDYLRGNRKGKSANRLEREALSDPFLHEALEGLTSIADDPIDGLIRLERYLDERACVSKKKNRAWLYVAASVLLLAMCGALWFMPIADRSPVLEGEIAMVASREVLDEVVLSDSLPIREKSSMSTNTMEVLVADTIVSPDDIKRFNRYAETSLKYPEKDVENGREGVVLASFELNSKKIPSRIRIKEGFSEESNKELIRLLAKGPKWEQSFSGKRIYVSARFTIGKDGAKHTLSLQQENPF